MFAARRAAGIRRMASRQYPVILQSGARGNRRWRGGRYLGGERSRHAPRVIKRGALFARMTRAVRSRGWRHIAPPHAEAA